MNRNKGIKVIQSILKLQGCRFGFILGIIIVIGIPRWRGFVIRALTTAALPV